jgi:hypothetical protein
MKPGVRVFVVTIGIAVGASATAWATDVVNQDAKPYTLTIVDGSVKSTKKLESKGAIYGLCASDTCTFKIPGSTIKAGKNERIVISKGKFKK